MVTEAQGRATRKYRTKAYDRIEVLIDGSVPLVAPSQEPHKGPSEPSDS